MHIEFNHFYERLKNCWLCSFQDEPGYSAMSLVAVISCKTSLSTFLALCSTDVSLCDWSCFSSRTTRFASLFIKRWNFFLSLSHMLFLTVDTGLQMLIFLLEIYRKYPRIFFIISLYLFKYFFFILFLSLCWIIAFFYFAFKWKYSKIISYLKKENHWFSNPYRIILVCWLLFYVQSMNI